MVVRSCLHFIRSWLCIHRNLVSSHIDCLQGTIVFEPCVYSHDMIFLVIFVFLSCTRDEIFRETHDSPANRPQCTTRTITRNIYYSAPHWTGRDGSRLCSTANSPKT